MKNLSGSAIKPSLLLVGLMLTGTVGADSLWKPGLSRNQVTDKTARAVGDLVTVVVYEKNVINKSAKSETKKESADDAKIESFLYGTATGAAHNALKHKGAYPAMKFSLSNSFKGEGSVANSDDISATFTVRVIDVLPNGNMILEGMRRTSYAGETQDVILRGTVRRLDITGTNKVNSNQIADLSLRYINSGEITDGQRKGWFKRFWDSVSPF
jgi:flagellar L-ring protein precursor FlgH